MKITIIGMGNAGSTIGADLSLKGHSVILLKTSEKLHMEHFNTVKESGEIILCEKENRQSAKVTVTTDVEFAIKDAEIIIVYIQTNYHEKLIKRISPFLSDGQAIIFEPGYLSTCYLMEYCDKDLTIIEAESSPIDCRITSPGVVNVLYKNVMNPFGVYPSSKKEHAAEVLSQLEYPFEFTSSVVEAALHNPNLIVHTIGAIFSIPRIEYTKGDYWMYKEVFTPHVWNIVESLDDEKMNVLEKFSCKRVQYVEACQNRNSLDKNSNALEVFFDYANNWSPSGPTVPDSRYITEDVPDGLCLLESLGEFLDIPTPTCTGLINVASAALKRDFRKEGKNVDRIGKENIQKILDDMNS